MPHRQRMPSDAQTCPHHYVEGRMHISCGMTTTIQSDTSYQNFAVLWGVNDSTEDCCHAVTRSTAADDTVLRVLYHRLRHTTTHRRNHYLHNQRQPPHSVSFLQTSHPIGCVRLELRHSGICVHAAHYHRSRQKRITGPEHVPAQHTASVTPHSARATAIIHSYSYCWGRAAGYRIPYRVADRETTLRHGCQLRTKRILWSVEQSAPDLRCVSQQLSSVSRRPVEPAQEYSLGSAI